MADGFVVDAEEAAVIAAMESLGDTAQMHVNTASRDTAIAVEREAVARLRRQTGRYSTGLTEAGIESKPADDGNGYVVVSGREPFPNLPLWIEKGTKKGDLRSSTQPARPFFYVSAELEKGAHFRRLEDALQDAIDEKGLGE